MSRALTVILGTMVVLASVSCGSAQNATQMATVKPRCLVACDYRCTCSKCLNNLCPYLRHRHHHSQLSPGGTKAGDLPAQQPIRPNS